LGGATGSPSRQSCQTMLLTRRIGNIAIYNLAPFKSWWAFAHYISSPSLLQHLYFASVGGAGLEPAASRFALQEGVLPPS